MSRPNAVFHVTDQIGRKLTDPSLPEFIQRALVPFHRPRNGPSPKFTTCLGNVVGPGGPDVSDCAALEFTVHDRPGLLSSITSVLVDNGCHVASGQAWTHNGRAAGVLYVTATADAAGATALLHPSRWARIERLVNAVVDARENVTGERHWVCMSEPVHGRVHTERRLHQLMHDDRDYESGPAPTPVDEELFSMGEKAATARTARRTETRVSIDSWEERGYAVVKMTSRDRPRLLFDTVCALTDMHYVVFHATVGSQGPLAIQEYYIRHKDGRTVDSNAERQKVSRCLVAAVERRATHVRLDHPSPPFLLRGRRPRRFTNTRRCALACRAGHEGGGARRRQVRVAVGLHQGAAGARPLAAQSRAQEAQGRGRRHLLPRHGHRQRGAHRGGARRADEGSRDGHLARHSQGDPWLAAGEEDQRAGAACRRAAGPGEAEIFPREPSMVTPREAIE
ncbi:hypothetical protein SEVIR_9G105000v4 [Setaria viridis]